MAIFAQPEPLPLEGEVLPQESGALVTVEPGNVQKVFTEPGALDPLIAAIREHVRAQPKDASTEEGRKAIKSLARKVATSKTYLDGLGKDLVASMKELPKRIDATRASMRDDLDALKVETLAGVTAYEAEQERLAALEAARVAAEELARQIEQDHADALAMDELFTLRKEAARRAQLDREEQIRKDAAEQAQKDAEARAQAERDAAARREAQAKLDQAAAEQRAKDAEARAEQEKKDAERRAQEAADAATAAERRRNEEAQAAEAQRQKDAEAAKQRREAAELAEQVRQAQDVEHRRAFNREALADLETAFRTGAVALENPTEAAKAVLTAIVTGKVRHIAITY